MRIALAQLNPIVGDIAGNTTLVLDAMAQARQQQADVLVTSELTLIGYPPRDLLQRRGVVEECERAVRIIAEQAGDLHVIVGHPRRSPGGMRPWRNSASVCHRGKIIAVCDKQLLPGYDVFDEDRYFEPGDRSCVVQINDKRCGIVICEDLWRANDVSAERRYPVEPVREIARMGCDVLFSLNASPFVLGKWQRHLAQLRDIAVELQVPICAVNQVGANDDLIFDGRSVVLDSRGRVVSMLKPFESEVTTIAFDILNRGGTAIDVSHWSEPCRELFFALSRGVRDYVHKTGHRSLLLGLSGGIDSALTAVIAAAAIGPANVFCVMMPSRYSSTGSIDDSIELARRLGLPECKQVPIGPLHEVMRTTMQKPLGDSLEGVTDENIQARLRGIILMAMSNANNALVLATSNKSELAVGYSTMYGDMCGALAPLGDVSKTRIYELSRWINANFQECGFRTPPIPESSITKAPSAELRPNQTDQDSLPPYEVLDRIIEHAVELEDDEAAIISQTGFDAALIRKTLRMIDRAQYKRDQAPVVLKVTSRAFGRGRPMPIVMKQSSNAADTPGRVPAPAATVMKLTVDD